MIKKLLFFLPVISLFLGCDFNSATTVTTGTTPIPTQPVSKEKWTILIYMAADNNLEAEAMEDIWEMEMSKLNQKYVNILILLDRHPGYDVSNGNWNGTKMFLLKTGRNQTNKTMISQELSCPQLNLSAGIETELDMSSPYILANAINFMRQEYKTDHYGLIIWGHGTGWRNEIETSESNENTQNKGFSFDSTSGTYMSLSQLNSAIQMGTENAKLDFIGFDTCYGGAFEVMYELKDSALYGIGTPGLLMSSGWNYQIFFDAFNEKKQKNFQSLYESIVFQFQEQYGRKAGASICVYNLEKIDDYFEAFETFMEATCSSINSAEIRDYLMNEVYFNVLKYSNGDSGSDVYLDINSLIGQINSAMTEHFSDCGDTSKEFDEFCEKAKEFTIGGWSFDREEAGPGIYFATLSESGLYASKHPSGYTKGAANNQIRFVEDSNWYVPSREKNRSFMDKLFYTTSW